MQTILDNLHGSHAKTTDQVATHGGAKTESGRLTDGGKEHIKDGESSGSREGKKDDLLKVEGLAGDDNSNDGDDETENKVFDDLLDELRNIKHF